MKHLLTTVSTPYGMVDQAVLENLRNGYSSGQILQLVDVIDAIRARLADPDGVRADLLRLHAMAHTVINGAALTVAPNETAVWEMADELTTEFRDWIELFARAVDRLTPLAELVPKE